MDFSGEKLMESNPITGQWKEINQTDVDAETRAEFFANGKTEVNELLFQYLPGETKLRDMDDLSVKVFDLIAEFWAGK